jgi:protein-S-isoprenylcysteine O-methyltransferase Ste14
MKKALIVIVYTIVFWAVLPAGLIYFGLAVDRTLELSTAPLYARIAGGILASLAAPFLFRALLDLSQRGRGLPISHLPPTELVAGGIYARCRHPIYVAYNAVFAGLGLGFGSWGVGVGAGLLLLLAWIAYALLLEEPKLRARYGKKYYDYAQSTPLLPLRW